MSPSPPPTPASSGRGRPGRSSAGSANSKDAADELVARLPRVTLVVGKGGVGKTTCAAALALRSARTRGDTLVLTTDPARALPTVLGQEIGDAPTPVQGVPRLAAQALDASRLRTTFMQRWSETIRVILDRGTYLDDSDIGPMVDTALPGSDEIFSALHLAQLVTDDADSDRRIVVDTAPTGHTLRLLRLPGTFRALIGLLESMQAKHRFMVRTLTRGYRADDADAFLAEMTRLVTALEDTLGDPARCAAVMVTQPQSMVIEETRRFAEELQQIPVAIAALVWNRTDGAPPPAPFAIESQYVVPALESWPTGVAGLEQWARGLAPTGRGVAQKQKAGVHATPRSSTTDPAIAELLRPLTIVAGKGGVGKTTVACALAIAAGDGRRTLVVSTDPAPSVADVLRQNVPDADTPVTGVADLWARQMDATAAFARLRAEYETRVDALFEGLMGRGVDLTQDRAIARELLSLAPPGVDEVYALSLLSDALFRDRYERVVVDPAPTGHLLRLLEMPQLALSWSHQLLRLMLKYKEVAGLGDAAREILDFAKSLRAVDALLHDSTRCGVVLVTLDEPVVQAETDRLAHAVHQRNIGVTGIIRNRASEANARARALPATDAVVHFEAPRVEPPPLGPDSLRAWAATWRREGR